MKIGQTLPLHIQGFRQLLNRGERSTLALGLNRGSLPIEAQLKFLRQSLVAGPDYTALALRPDPSQSSLFASPPETGVRKR
jgi:hypothetical protein